MAESLAVTFATGAEWPDGDGERTPLTEALRRRGLASRWEVWSDDAVDWAATPLVMIRTTWDYPDRLDDYFAWARRVESVSRLFNAASVLEWNTHKGYLVDLARAGVPCVPTWVGLPGDDVDGRVRSSDRVVVKPAVGVTGQGLAVRPADAVWDGQPAGVDHVVQPLLTSVLTDGELSVFVIDGRVVAGVVKRPAEGEVRVHEEYGGQFRAAPVPAPIADRAVDAVAVSARLRAVELPYARVDFLRDDTGEWVVSEVELVEPSLYPDIGTEVIEAYAGVVARLATEAVG